MVDFSKMESEENLAEAHAFADGHYAGLQFVLEVFKENDGLIVSTARLSNASTGRQTRDQVLGQLWTRAYAWMLSIERLNHPKYYQAVATACRALLEIAVDVALIKKGDGDGDAIKMLCFMESEKLKMCESVINYFIKDCKKDVDPIFAENHAFVLRNKTKIEANRLVWWPKEKKDGTKYAIHPNRWTGMDLSVDVKKVDELYGDEISDELGMSLTQFYRTEYRRINWHIHSGLASTWDMPAESFGITVGHCIQWSADLAFLIAKLILLDFGVPLALPNIRDRWADIKAARDRIFVEKVDGTFIDPDINEGPDPESDGMKV